MKTTKILCILILVLAATLPAAAENDEHLIPIYDGSRVIYDDQFGYEELWVVMDDETTVMVEGVLRRLWCEAPEGRSPLEVIRNYESAVKDMGGEVIFLTRDPQSIQIDDKTFANVFAENRNNRGLATNVMTQNSFPGLVSEYLVAKLSTVESSVYVVIGVGRGHWAANQSDRTYFEIVTVETEPMELGLVTMDYLRDSMNVQGHAAVYDILFDTGSWEIRPESAEALAVIAEFLRENAQDRFLVVGHTDNIGSYALNLRLSEARANSVVEYLVGEHGADPEQLKAVGVAFASPVTSNATEEGRARNRRVEIVLK